MSVPQVWPCLPCVPQLSAVLWLPATLASQAQSVGPWSTRSSLPSLQSPLKVHYPSITLYQAVCSTHHTHPTHSGIFSSPPVLFSSWCSASPIISYSVSLTVVSLSRVGMDFCLLLHPQNQEKGPTHSRCLTYKLSCTEFNLWNWTGSSC